MAKSYWLATDRINDPTGIMVYAATAEAYLKKCGAKIFIRDAHTDVREGNPGHLTILIESPTVKAAKAAYEEPEYKDMIRLRAPNSEACFSIVREGDKLVH